MIYKQEPAFVELGFLPNKRGGGLKRQLLTCVKHIITEQSIKPLTGVKISLSL